MWQILWILTFIPDWIYQAILILGVAAIFAGYFLRFIPVVSAKRTPIIVAGVVLTTIGVWFNGHSTADAKWKNRVAELQVKVAESERLAAEATATVETVYVDRVKIVKEKEYIIQSQIRELSVDIDQNCRVSPRAVEILNSAAQNPVDADRDNSK